MIDVAMFGAGRIGKIHAGNVIGLPDVRLRYVVDVDTTAAGTLAQRHGAKVASAKSPPGTLSDAPHPGHFALRPASSSAARIGSTISRNLTSSMMCSATRRC